MSHIIVDVANQLFKYSNKFIKIRCDPQMPIPAFSFIEEDIHGLFQPIIIINPSLITDNASVIAHILAHEWGHHTLGHILHPNVSRNERELEHTRKRKENEADAYAAKFIKDHNYDINSIVFFIKQHPFDIENRLNILQCGANE